MRSVSQGWTYENSMGNLQDRACHRRKLEEDSGRGLKGPKRLTGGMIVQGEPPFCEAGGVNSPR